jgi:hypothetical protein
MRSNGTFDAARKRVQQLDWAAQYPGRARERLLALAEAEEIFCRLHPEHDHAVQVVRSAAHVRPGRPACDGPVRQAENHLIDLLWSLVSEAVRSGELPLPARLCTEQVAVGMWTLGFGRRAIINTAANAEPLSAEEAFRTTRATLSLLADCLEWRPLSTEWDYRASRRGIQLHLMKDHTTRGHLEDQFLQRERCLRWNQERP